MNLCIIVSLLVLVIFILYYYFSCNNLVKVKSIHDYRYYNVRDFKNKQQSADLLAQVRESMIKLVNHLKYKYPNNHQIIRLMQRFNPDVINESMFDKNNTSYTVNKGEHIAFCIRPNKNNYELMPLNHMIFIAIHELAHVMSDYTPIGGDDHDTSFWNNMKFLLRNAIDIKIYTYYPYHLKPVNYCDIEINNTPYKI
jgi:hypothetical protein